MQSRTAGARLAAVIAAGALSLGIVAAPASAQSQSGLVNVAIIGNTVQVPVGVAADICGVSANVIASNSFTGNTLCVSSTRPSAQGGGGGGGGGSQQGLVNVAIVGNTVQVPVAVAANVCGVAVNLIATGSVTGSSTCSAISSPIATA